MEDANIPDNTDVGLVQAFAVQRDLGGDPLAMQFRLGGRDVCQGFVFVGTVGRLFHPGVRVGGSPVFAIGEAG